MAEAATTRPGLDDIDPDDKLYDPYDVLRICRSLVSLSEGKVIICGKLEVRQIVRFAHASVREYLLSDHITQGLAASFSIPEKQSHEHISQCCLSILLRNNAKHQLPPGPEAMPLLRYAAEFWFQHTKDLGSVADGTITYDDLITKDYANRLFITFVTIFQNWLTIYDPNIKRGSNRLRGSDPSPLYYAALLGLVESTRELLALGYDVNALGGRYGTALVAAAMNGNESMVRLLVDRDAEVICFGGVVFGSPLQAACYSGSESIVRLLIERGASVNSNRGTKHNTPLQVACEFGYESLVRLLIRSGANVKAYGGGFGYALQAAAVKKHHAIVALLLDEGAEVNARGGHYGSALQGAVAGGSESVTRLLLDAGADPNAQAGGFRDSLRAAAWRQEQSIFDLLLERGADVDLSVRRLQDNQLTTPLDKELAESIHRARVDNSPMLMDLVSLAAKRIARIENEERTAQPAASQKSIQPNRWRLRKMVHYVLKQDSDQYQDASISTTWLATTKIRSQEYSV